MMSGSSFDYLDRHAREAPDRIAITGPRGQIDWARFRSDAGRAARALETLGLQPGRIAVISHPDPYVEWLLTIACDSLGIISASLPPGDADAGQLLGLADLVLTEERVAGLLAQTGGMAGDHRRHPAGADTPIRIIRTSGSTGTPKCLLLTRRMQNHWIDGVITLNFRGEVLRYYAAYPLSVNPHYFRMEACLRRGGTIILGQTSQDLVTYEASDAWLLPRDMEKLLQGVRGGRWPSPRPLHMSLAGGPVSTALYDATASLFGTKVLNSYGTNEVGRVGQVDRNGVVTLFPDVELQILDESEQPSPPGEAGRIVVRTPGIAAGYLNDPEANAEHFRQGWFYTDDVGVRLDDGHFRLVGRRSEIINLGGIKILPLPIEEKLRANIPGIQEVVVTSIPGPQGIEELCLAIVPAPSADRSAIVAAIGREIDSTLGQVWLRLFDKLPVGASGKVQQAALREIFAAGRQR